MILFVIKSNHSIDQAFAELKSSAKVKIKEAMFKNYSEGKRWLEEQQNRLKKLSEVATTGDYFIVSHTFLRKVSISRIMSRKIIFGEGDIYSNKAVFRKELLEYRVVPPGRIQEFENKLERIKELHDLE